MLWLALRCPLLALEALPLRSPPSAVVTRGRVLLVDAAAQAGGVLPGQKPSTALGLLPALRVFERDAACEAEALQDLAIWAGAFTPSVCLVPPDGILLEIGSCLRLFGGLPALLERVLTGARTQGWTFAWSVAGTPLGAHWLAGSDAACVADTHVALVRALDGLPLTVTAWPDAVLARLTAFGLRSLGALRALPSTGLRQRIGSERVDELLRAYGDLPDLRATVSFPESFERDLALPARIEQTAAIVFAGQRLLAALAGWLQVRQRLLRQASLFLVHESGEATVLRLCTGEASADEARWVRLLREHLGILRLRAPVVALRLTADEVVPLSAHGDDLFGQAVPGEGRLACLERLRARLGEGAVSLPEMRADHRPECATQLHDVLASASRSTSGSALFPMPADKVPTRPLWLLPAPQALTERAGRPRWRGELEFVTRAERLESGWWENGEQNGNQPLTGDVRRDYFVVRNPLGQWGWIFRDASGWYLHGLFA